MSKELEELERWIDYNYSRRGMSIFVRTLRIKIHELKRNNKNDMNNNLEVKFAVFELKDGKILKDGHTMFFEDVVKELNRKSFLEKERLNYINPSPPKSAEEKWIKVEESKIMYRGWFQQHDGSEFWVEGFYYRDEQNNSCITDGINHWTVNDDTIEQCVESATQPNQEKEKEPNYITEKGEWIVWNMLKYNNNLETACNLLIQKEKETTNQEKGQLNESDLPKIYNAIKELSYGEFCNYMRTYFINQENGEELDKCHLCNSSEGEILICERCDSPYCDDCSSVYNQFTQIDYNCCKKCAERKEE